MKEEKSFSLRAFSCFNGFLILGRKLERLEALLTLAESWLFLAAFCHSCSAEGHCTWTTGSVLSLRLAWVWVLFHPQVVEHQCSGIKPLCSPDCAPNCYLRKDCWNSPGEGIWPGTSCWRIWVCPHISLFIHMHPFPHQVPRDVFKCLLEV